MKVEEPGESRLVSPKQMQAAAIEIMLDGKPPKTHEDWCKCINFWAANAADGLEEEICFILCLIYLPPVSIMATLDIIKFQQEIKEVKKSKVYAAQYN